MVELKARKKKHNLKKHKSKNENENDVEIFENDSDKLELNFSNIINEKSSKRKINNNNNNKKKKKEKKNKKEIDDIDNSSDNDSEISSKKRKHSSIIDLEERKGKNVKKNKKSKKNKNLEKIQSRNVMEEEGEEIEMVKKKNGKDEEIEENEEEKVKKIRKKIKELKSLESQKEIEEFTDIEKEDEMDLEEDIENESVIAEENELVKEGFKINDWENMTNEEFNEKIKSLPRKKFKAIYTNYLLSFKPILFQLSSRYLSDTNYLLGLVQKYKNSKTSLATKYNKISAWPIPLSEQVPIPFRSYDIFTSEENKRNEEILYKKVIDNDIFFSDLLKEETKAYINEYWKKIHHQERYEYNELKKVEEKEKKLLNDNDDNNIIQIDDENESNVVENNGFSLLSDEKISIIQIECLNKLKKVIDDMITEQSFIIRYRKSLPDVIGINNAGNIMIHALNSGIPLSIIRSTFDRLSNLIEEDHGNHSIYKKLAEILKGMEKKEENEKQKIIDEENNQDVENNNDNNARTNNIKNSIEDQYQDNLNDLRELAGKYTLLKYGNSLKQIKIKKNIEDYVYSNNVLNLYSFK